LRDGACVILSGDLDTTGSGPIIDLFGGPARLPHGAVKLALMTGAPLLRADGWREDMADPARYRVRVSPPVAVEGSARSRADVRAGVEKLKTEIERSIAARPEQWLAFRQVWLVP
jgi:phosphatidylinositol dimannoside acyltransferase